MAKRTRDFLGATAFLGQRTWTNIYARSNGAKLFIVIIFLFCFYYRYHFFLSSMETFFETLFPILRWLTFYRGLLNILVVRCVRARYLQESTRKDGGRSNVSVILSGGTLSRYKFTQARWPMCTLNHLKMVWIKPTRIGPIYACFNNRIPTIWRSRLTALLRATPKQQIFMYSWWCCGHAWPITNQLTLFRRTEEEKKGRPTAHGVRVQRNAGLIFQELWIRRKGNIIR